MKKRRRPAAKKTGKTKRKPIMRHSREGAKSRRKKGRGKPGARPKKASRKARAPRARAAARKKPSKSVRRRRGEGGVTLEPPPDARGMGAESGGQSGDTEGLSRAEEADFESVEELAEEGQAFEAGVIEGVESARDPDEGEVETREVPEDDVPQEYLDKD
ncbi:MAG TPA: hypothetical protein VMR54_14535 [Thermoanaerobaculia bacterium]|nr:hypothetical protein [Thermoanaerobaculia bacterium]